MFISLEQITKQINNTTYYLVTIVKTNLVHLYFITRRLTNEKRVHVIRRVSLFL